MTARSKTHGVKRLFFSTLICVIFSATDVRAELVLESVSWQRVRMETSRIISWEDLGRLIDGPPKFETRLRARLTLKNRGPVSAEGILLRYSMTGRIAPNSANTPEGVWGIPFMVDAKHVPKVGPNKTQNVYLVTSPALELYSAKLARAGWWPDRVKLQVMIEPHRGAVAVQTLESVLEVAK